LYADNDYCGHDALSIAARRRASTPEIAGLAGRGRIPDSRASAS
jgi:hypothetical protein